MNITELAQQARTASIATATLGAEIKNKALSAIAQALEQNSSAIITANENDLAQAKKDNLSTALLKRLKFDKTKIKADLEKDIAIEGAELVTKASLTIR